MRCATPSGASGCPRRPPGRPAAGCRSRRRRAPRSSSRCARRNDWAISTSASSTCCSGCCATRTAARRGRSPTSGSRPTTSSAAWARCSRTRPSRLADAFVCSRRGVGSPAGMRRLIAFMVTFTVCLAAPATAGGPDHVVNASPTAEGQQMHRSGVQVVSTGADTVDSTNLARAVPHDCTGCEGIAVAFQAVIATGSPHDVSPTNAAVAVNSNCTSCTAFAFAYRYAVTTDGPATVSEAGRDKVRAIRYEVAQTIDADQSPAELDAKLKSLAADFKAAVRDDLESHGKGPHGGRADTTEDAAPTSSG